MARSVRVSSGYRKKLKLALRLKGFPSQRQLAKELGIARSTVSKFFNGHPVDVSYFEEICKRLNQDWKEIADLGQDGEPEEAGGHRQPNDTATQPPAPIAPYSGNQGAEVWGGVDDGETRWVGRQALIAELIQRLREDWRVLSIVGITGIGKTSLAAKLTLEPELRQWLPVLRTVRFLEDLPNFEVVARRVLGEVMANDRQLQQDEEALIGAVVAKLQSQPCLLVLDMIEELLEADGEGGHRFKQPAFAKFLDRAVLAEPMPSRIVLTSQDQPPVLAGGRFPQKSQTVRLGGLQESEARELFEMWEVGAGEAAEWEHLQRIVRVYEGHPLALKVIAGEIREQYAGDVEAYWHECGSEIEAVERLKTAPEERSREDKPGIDRSSPRLKDLVKSRVEKSFARLQKAHPLACLMLCMGAIYRRAVEKQAWLIQLAEYPQEAVELAFHTLQRRFFLETEKPGRKVLYRSHNLIRRVALDNLSRIEEEVLQP